MKELDELMSELGRQKIRWFYSGKSYRGKISMSFIKPDKVAMIVCQVRPPGSSLTKQAIFGLNETKALDEWLTLMADKFWKKE
jgi:hypothetical protein